jgi:hypothetical protein
MQDVRDLFLQASVSTPPCREIRKAYQEASQEFHVRSSALTLKERAMIGAARRPAFPSWRIDL